MKIEKEINRSFVEQFFKIAHRTIYKIVLRVLGRCKMERNRIRTKKDTAVTQPTQSFANSPVPLKMVIGILLGTALVAFELFNFDTTRFALANLLGEANFIGIRWAGILALAFCAIDFAGLARIFTPERGWEKSKGVWYLLGAWLLGATMNAIMTWWAVSLTLLAHDFGNEVLGREQLLRWVPFFIAVLVWLTRILFIGALSVAGDYVFDFSQPQAQNNSRTVGSRPYPPTSLPPTAQPMRAKPKRQTPTQPSPARPSPTATARPRRPAGMVAQPRK